MYRKWISYCTRITRYYIGIQKIACKNYYMNLIICVRGDNWGRIWNNNLVNHNFSPKTVNNWWYSENTNFCYIIYWLPQAITDPHLGCQPSLLLQMPRERPSTSWQSEAASNSWSVCRDKLDCSTNCNSSSPHDHEASYILMFINGKK